MGCSVSHTLACSFLVGLSASAADQSREATLSRFPLSVSKDKRYLVDINGMPFLVVGDTAWSLFTQLSKTEALVYLDDRKKRGFNAVIVSLIEHKFTTKAPDTFDGVKPFKKAGDFTQPNPDYFDHAHKIVSAANERGISVWLCPAYLGVNGGDEGWFQEIDKAGEKVLRAYGKFVGERFKDLPNIVWMPGGDYDVPKEKRWAAEQLALGLRDGGAMHLMTAHGCQKSAVATFGDRDWLAIDNVYSYQPDPWKDHRVNFKNKTVRPSVLIEGLYENEYADKTDPANIRRQAWWALTNGACGQFFGNAPLWHLGGPGFSQSNKPWKPALDLPGSHDHARLGKFFGRLPWHTLTPDMDDKLVTAGGGEKDQKITAARSADGKVAVLYVPPSDKKEREFTLDLSGFKGDVSGRWFDPSKDANDQPLPAPLSAKAEQKVRTPGKNGGDTTDWVLVLEVLDPPTGPKPGKSTSSRVLPPSGDAEAARAKLTVASVGVKTTDVMEARTFTEAGTGEVMPYRLFKVGNPEKGKKYPLVVLFHHATRGGDDNTRQVKDDAGAGLFCLPATQEKYPCFVLAPQAGGKGKPEVWSDVTWTGPADQPWPKEPNRNMRLALAILDEVAKEFPVDPARIYTSGASMGSYGTHDAITRRPDFFAAAVTICGGYTTAGADKLSGTPIWTFHGDADETIEVERSRKLFAAVVKAGGNNFTYWEYAGVRHTFARDLAYADPAVLEWLFAQCRTADWPNFAGPDRTNAVAGPKLLAAWPKDGPPHVWTRSDLGNGYSAPVVKGDRIYLMVGDDKSEHLLCLDAITGKTLWTEKVGSLFENEYGNGPRGSPTVHAGRVFTLGSHGDLLATDTAGKRLWSVNLTADLGGEAPGWGYSESPLVDDDRVVVTPGGKQGTLAALDPATGKVLWRSDAWTDRAMYSSLAMTDRKGKRQYVGVTREHVAGVSAADGMVLWKERFGSSVVVAQSPVVSGGRVYVTASGGTGCRGFKLTADGTAEKTFANKVMNNLPGGVALYAGHVFGYSDGPGWVCQDFATGKEVWSSKDFPKGTLTIADGKLILLSEDTGEVALVDATAKEFEVVSRFKLTPQSKIRLPKGRVWTVPVVANGRLYLRDQERLFHYDLRPRRAAAIRPDLPST